jgi:hypothetical protein
MMTTTKGADMTGTVTRANFSRKQYLRPSTERVLAFRERVDVDTNAKLSDELLLRAELLRSTVEIPVEDREPYERVAARVETYYGDDGWKQGRVARRAWVTGEGLWHARFVLFGTQDGSGCDCNRPACKARREPLA